MNTSPSPHLKTHQKSFSLVCGHWWTGGLGQLPAIDRMLVEFPNADIVFIESGGTNLKTLSGVDQVVAFIEARGMLV